MSNENEQEELSPMEEEELDEEMMSPPKKDKDEDKEVYNDRYDIYNSLSKVHSPDLKGIISRDYILAGGLSDEAINGKTQKFIREQVKMIRIIHSFLIVSDDVLAKKYNKWNYYFVPKDASDEEKEEINKLNIMKRIEKAKLDKTALARSYENIRALLKSEMDTIVALSRSAKGEVLEAGLDTCRNREEHIETPPEPTRGEILTKEQKR